MNRFSSPADQLVQRQQAAYTTYTRLRVQLDTLAPGHPAHPALRTAVRQAEHYWRTLDGEATEAATLAALAALGLSRRDFSPWAA